MRIWLSAGFVRQEQCGVKFEVVADLGKEDIVADGLLLEHAIRIWYRRFANAPVCEKPGSARSVLRREVLAGGSAGSVYRAALDTAFAASELERRRRLI